MKLCTVCGVVTSRAGSRCTTHARQSDRSRHNALYSTRSWQRLSARVLRAWRGEHGDRCPGYERPAHAAADLTVDHVVPLAARGAPFDIANTAVLCRSCNSTKGASTDRGGVAHVAASTRPDRALPLCARGRVSRIIPASRDVRPRASQGALRTAGEFRFAVLVELKKPDTALISGKAPYRNGAWRIGPEVAGGVSQLQANCERIRMRADEKSNVRWLDERRMSVADPEGILLVGHTRQLQNDEQRDSFHRFRRNLWNPTVLTYDELLERARFLVAKAAAKAESAEAAPLSADQEPSTATILAAARRVFATDLNVEPDDEPDDEPDGMPF